MSRTRQHVTSRPPPSSAPTSAPASTTSPIPSPSLTLDLPRESKRSLILRRNGSRDEAGAGYELSRGQFHIHLEGVGRIGTALRLNATSIWFEPETQGLVPYGQMGRITFETPEETFGPFSTKFGIEALDDDVHAVARLLDVPHADGCKLVAFMLSAAARGWAMPVRPMAAVQTDITDEMRIRAVVQALAHRSAAAVLRCGDRVVHASLASFDEESGALFWLYSDPGDTVPPEGEITVEVAGYNCVYQMRFESATRAAMGVFTGTPGQVDYNRYRRYRRAPIADMTAVRFQHPLWAEIAPFDRPLLDVSFGGIAFVADPLRDALYIGLRVDLIELVSDSADTILLRGTVRSLIELPDGTTSCGMSVEPRSHEFAEGWASFVMQALNQTTAPGDDHVDKLWELYTDSGYFSLSGKDPHEFDALSKSFRSIVERTRSKPWVSYNSVWPSATRIEASVSTIKLYRNTWMLHQLAKRKATHGDPRARHILRDIYLRAFEYMQTDTRCRWVLSYCEAHVRWVQRSHISFAEHFEATGAAMARPFRLMEVNCLDRLETGPAGQFRIAAAAPDEQQIILDVLRATLPESYLEACDLVADRLDLSSIRRVWGDVGLSRSREVWVARHGYSPVAAAILEIGETGTNLFRLTDSLRLVAIQPGGEVAFWGLIERAKAWFLAKGKDSFVYFWEHPDAEHVRSARLRDLGEGRVWVIRSDLIPDFLELVCELTAHSGGPDPGRMESAVPGPVSMHGDGQSLQIPPPPVSTRMSIL